VPKFIMANGKMVQMLIHTDVARAPRAGCGCSRERSAHAATLCAQVKYLEFKAVDGSFVVRDKRVHKVPANDMEALRSPLMGMFEKRRARGFFIYVQDYNEHDQRTWQARPVHTSGCVAWR
jgi:Rab GDP dissociation inhibitor